MIILTYIRVWVRDPAARAVQYNQARSEGGANGCNCTPPLGARSTWQAMNIIHLIVYCSAMYTYLNASCLHVYCARVHVRALVRSKCRIGKMAIRHHACVIFGVNMSAAPYLVPIPIGVNSSLSSITHLNSKKFSPAFLPTFDLFSPLGAKGIFIYHSPMSMISGHTCKWMYNNNSILFLKIGTMS